MFGNRRGFLRGNGHVLRIESALGIVPDVGINFLAGFQPAHTRAGCNYGPGPVRTQHHGKLRTPLGPPTSADVGVPRANARGVQLDEHFVRVNLRHRQLVQREHFRTAKTVDRRCAHGLGNSCGHKILARQRPGDWRNLWPRSNWRDWSCPAHSRTGEGGAGRETDQCHP